MCFGGGFGQGFRFFVEREFQSSGSSSLLGRRTPAEEEEEEEEKLKFSERSFFTPQTKFSQPAAASCLRLAVGRTYSYCGKKLVARVQNLQVGGVWLQFDV